MAKPDKDQGLMLDILLAARDARAFLAGIDESAFMASRLHQNAVIRSLEVMGEAAGKISASLRAAHPEIPWRKIADMRNRLIHGYSNVRLDVVWSVACSELETIIEALAPLVPPPDAPGN